MKKFSIAGIALCGVLLAAPLLGGRGYGRAVNGGTVFGYVGADILNGDNNYIFSLEEQSIIVVS